MKTDADAAFLADFVSLSAFGATPDGGVDREALTEPDRAQRRWFADLMTSHGLTVRYDRAGNQYGLSESNPGGPFVLVGSHLDSQPTAGRFDGAYGVLAALHAVSAVIADGSRLRHNLAVVNWFNEEGSRFAPSMMGSSVYTGSMSVESALQTSDRNGNTVGSELDDAGFRSGWDGPEAVSYAEIHVEQGRVLENVGAVIGVVTATWAAHKYRVVVRGVQAHSGATVMEDRHDALFGASLVVVAAREIADMYPGVVHTAVGQLDVYPNSPVVVASEVSLLLDIRAADPDAVAAASEELGRRIPTIEDRASVTIELVETHSWGINSFGAAGADLTREVSNRLGLRHSDVLTVAGHDSVNMKEHTPTVMIFVPSVQGISHNTQELTSDSDLIAGLNVLTEVVRELGHGRLESEVRVS